jgi:hypothetical protein
MCDKRGTNSLVTQRHDRVERVCGDAAKCGHHNKLLKINENKATRTARARMSISTQKSRRPDLVYESLNLENGGMKWKLVEITCPWPWIDYDGETLEKAYRKKVDKYDVLRADFKRDYPNQEVEEATIVVGATGVFHKRFQIEFAESTCLGKQGLGPLAADCCRYGIECIVPAVS